MAAMLDSSGNVILYDTSQRIQQTTQGDAGRDKRGVISQLIEKVRTKEDRKKSPEDRERGQVPRERSKSDGRAEIIRAKAALEELQASSVPKQPAGIAKSKGKKEQRYGRDGKVASIYHTISGRMLGSKTEQGVEPGEMRQTGRLPPPPPPARRAPHQDPNAEIRERLEIHLKEKLQDIITRSNIAKHIVPRPEKSLSLDAQTMDDINYQRISEAILCSPEDRKSTRALVHRDPQR